MINRLEKIINSNETININDIYDFFTTTTDVFIIKYDGMRESKKFNIIIIAKESRFETINFEIENLQEGIIKALVEYQKNI
jgi:hypothetical protein